MHHKGNLPIHPFSLLCLSHLGLSLLCCGISLCNVESSCFLRSASGEAKEVWIEFLQDVLKRKTPMFNHSQYNQHCCLPAEAGAN